MGALEADTYYSGLCSRPTLLYRSGTSPWVRSSLDWGRDSRRLRPVFGHRMNVVWKDLGGKICQTLDSKKVLWSSVDVVRFTEAERRRSVGPVILWIGVLPNTLSKDDACVCADACLHLLKQFDLKDVEVEFRYSTYTRFVLPTLHKPATDGGSTDDFHAQLTPLIGNSIAAEDASHGQGSVGLYLAEGGDSDSILLLTARHVLFPPDTGLNVAYDSRHLDPGVDRRKVVLLGDKAHADLLVSIKKKIGRLACEAEMYQGRINEWQQSLQQGDTTVCSQEDLERETSLVAGKNEAIEAHVPLYTEVRKEWRSPRRRAFGHIICSPPITTGTGTQSFTEDYAIAAVDKARMEKGAFHGNVIDLGMNIKPVDFMRRMEGCTKDGLDFTYPSLNRLFPLEGILPEEIMREPDLLDLHDLPCLSVLKRGSATGVTTGRANGVFSYVREYFDNGTHRTSMEWAILPHDADRGPFAAPGDSGAAVADALGRIGGLITGGTGSGDGKVSDVTYATPFFWLLPRVKENGFPNAHLDLVAF
ncbi:uncharacterized protein BXZ73DRAFT_38417 [Epithele typhae]|uniref:uncharacterized protein n=1 Tax=Epithele typhae TaxID=378194 RepID=UPI00200730BB|nr:uncharacterized protein BXZ73DRAFT_38417 [Epithele typhae]KAH9945059.1 hypothetical protein BXZ73DRAFT_38417 [Epithele typhae]